MYKFKECNQCLHEFNDKNLEPCKDCVPKKKTNADRIRAMDDAELAEFLLHFQHCDICDEQLEMYCAGECTKNIVKWLQSEVE